MVMHDSCTERCYVAPNNWLLNYSGSDLSELKSVGYASCACIESFECLNAVGVLCGLSQY